jgi:hypothetical protein
MSGSGRQPAGSCSLAVDGVMPSGGRAGVEPSFGCYAKGALACGLAAVRPVRLGRIVGSVVDRRGTFALMPSRCFAARAQRPIGCVGSTTHAGSTATRDDNRRAGLLPRGSICPTAPCRRAKRLAPCAWPRRAAAFYAIRATLRNSLSHRTEAARQLRPVQLCCRWLLVLSRSARLWRRMLAKADR